MSTTAKQPLTTPASFSLPPDMQERLDRAAAEFMQTRSSLVRMVLEGWLQRIDHPAARDALAALPTEDSHP